MKKVVNIAKVTNLIIKKDDGEKHYTIHSNFQWRYIEPEQDITETITSYDECADRGMFISYPTGKFLRKKYGDRYSEFYSWNEHIRFSTNNFIAYKITTKYHELHNYTLQQLMEKLPADEMIEYLKDNGLNVCPIAR